MNSADSHRRPQLLRNFIGKTLRTSIVTSPTFKGLLSCPEQPLMGFSDGSSSWAPSQDRSSNSNNAGGSPGVSRGTPTLGTGKCKHLPGSNTCSNCSGSSVARLMRDVPAALASVGQSRRRGLLLLCGLLSIGFLASSLSYQGAWNHSGEWVIQT